MLGASKKKEKQVEKRNLRKNLDIQSKRKMRINSLPRLRTPFAWPCVVVAAVVVAAAVVVVHWVLKKAW
jgi:hypothetical protein